MFYFSLQAIVIALAQNIETCSILRVARQQPANVEVYDPDVYLKGVPHDVFRLLRKECPVYFQTEPKGRGYYAITKYDDIVRISKDPQTFSSARGGTNIEDYPEDDLNMIRMLMVNMDPPQHNKFRKLVSGGFTPRMIRRMEDYTRTAAKQIIDNVAKKGRCDFVEDIAAQLPLAIICDLMGVPEHDRMKIFDWSNRLIGFDDPEFQTSIDDGREAAAEIWMYANELAESRRGKEGADLTSILINATVDGEQLTEMEFDSFILMLSVAGNETTRNLISGGMLALLEFPEQRRKLFDDLTLIPSAVEEMLRWVSPVMYFRRTVTRNTEIRGVELHPGDKVALYYGSANRDEDVFENPETFDITRSPNEHLAFGIGQHACLGLNLARLEIQVMFEEILRRIPDIRLDGQPVRLRSNFINGIKRMPVVFTPES
jgi:cholest-4-en-3-one 26-monooxygenase